MGYKKRLEARKSRNISPEVGQEKNPTRSGNKTENKENLELFEARYDRRGVSPVVPSRRIVPKPTLIPDSRRNMPLRPDRYDHRSVALLVPCVFFWNTDTSRSNANFPEGLTNIRSIAKSWHGMTADRCVRSYHPVVPCLKRTKLFQKV